MIPCILVVDDDEGIQEYLKEILMENGYSVKTASNGINALKTINKSQPDLVILDLNLPDMSGEGVCLELRKKYPLLPIIMLTAKDDIKDKVKGLRMGADDYVTKPFISDEFIARVKARLRNNAEKESKLKVADLELDNKRFQVTRGGKLLNFTPQEFRLLEYLMINKGVVLTREMILGRIWLYSPDVESRVVDVYIGYLRKKIDSGHKKSLFTLLEDLGTL